MGKCGGDWPRIGKSDIKLSRARTGTGPKPMNMKGYGSEEGGWPGMREREGWGRGLDLY